MKKQALTLAIAAALSAPSALAATDTSGMRYTSASEGFYASIRARYESGATGDAKGKIENSSSRVGVRGTNDLGGGLEGFYQYEWGVDINDTSRGQPQDRTRVGVVGLRGAFGEFRVGTFWVRSNDFVTGHTDVANVGSAPFTGHTGYRDSNRVEYTTPDLNGFQGAVRLAMPGGGKDGNNVSEWNISAKYDIKGFTVGALYQNNADGLEATPEVRHLGANGTVGGTGADADTTFAAKKKDDQSAWAVGLRYGQDNWYGAGWYGATESRSVNNSQSVGAFTDEDITNLSLAAGVSIDKIRLYGVWDKTEGNVDGQDGQEDTQATLGAQYNLGSNSRVWVEYIMRDNDSDKGDPKGERADNSFNVGLQHNF